MRGTGTTRLPGRSMADPAPLTVCALLICSSLLGGCGTGDVERGRAVFLDRERGHCLLCHQVAQLDAPFQGNLGPDLSNIGARFDFDALRARISDPLAFNPQSIMPAYHRTDHLHDVDENYRGQPVLSEQELIDVTAYLMSLKRPAT